MYARTYFGAIFFIIIIMMSTACVQPCCNRPETMNELVFPIAKELDEAIRILSYNIRGESATDCQQGNSWDIRKYKIRYLIQSYQPDIIGLQGVRACIHELNFMV